jgi:TRAP-type uncharacterized transport system fused permease subunit
MAAVFAPFAAAAITGADPYKTTMQCWKYTAPTFKTNLLERCLLLIAGFALVYPTTIADLIGFGFVVAALGLQILRRGTVPVAPA